MQLSEKLRNLRKQAGLSQEQLAEKLGVSRQAITKWETDAGTPEIGNLMALSALFQISLDELLLEKRGKREPADFPYESRTEYDIAGSKRFDMELGGAAAITLSGCEGEKLRAWLASGSIPDLQAAMKLHLEDERDRLDLSLRRMGELTRAEAKQGLHIFLELPRAYTGSIELRAQTGRLQIAGLEAAELEFSGRAEEAVIRDMSGRIELDSNADLRVRLERFSGRLDFNQISAASRVLVPGGWPFRAVRKGLGNRIAYAIDGARAEDFSDPEAENVIELNGMKSELLVEKRSAEQK